MKIKEVHKAAHHNFTFKQNKSSVDLDSEDNSVFVSLASDKVFQQRLQCYFKQWLLDNQNLYHVGPLENSTALKHVC